HTSVTSSKITTGKSFRTYTQCDGHVNKRFKFRLVRIPVGANINLDLAKFFGVRLSPMLFIDMEDESDSSSEDGQPLVLPAPLVIEDPPSNDDDSPDLEEHIKYLGDPALLNGSSGNFGSAGPRSAPTTPQGVFCGSTGSNSSLGLGTGQTGGLVINALGIGTQQQLQAGQQQQQTQQDQQLQLQQPFGGAASQPCTPGCTSPSIQRSPSHSVFTKCDKTNLKHLSTSTPQMTAQGQLTEPPSPKAYKEGKVRTTSKSHQKKFRRHFQNVNEEEVLNHYLCALIGDILLQGHLYITTNYFAFYSNVFGYVTKLLIPVLSVEKITKEKTARIIPNAVGIQTSDDKHVFGSLMSRDTTMQYMITVWQKAKNVNSALPIPPEVPDITPEAEIESSESAESGRDSPIDDDPPTFKKCDVPLQTETDIYERRSSKGLVRTVQEAISEFSKLPRQSLILFATTLLLILLFLSAGILLYRISKIQNRYSLAMQDSRSAGGEEIYSNLLQWQSHLHTKSAGAVNNFLDSNLDQIAKVRQSLEALSTLLISKENPLVRQDETSSASDKTTLES
ncbi:unnamed protein product, partial [Brassicogethes aeneus]